MVIKIWIIGQYVYEQGWDIEFCQGYQIFKFLYVWIDFQ